MQRLLSLLACVAVATIFTGASCATCASTSGASPPPPGTEACSTGQERVCVNQCRPVVSAEGAACVVNPCQGDASLGVCGVGFSCVPDPGQDIVGRCHHPPETGTLGQLVCDLNRPRDADNTCAAGWFCRQAECVQPQYRPSEGRDICSGGVPEGSACDGDWAEGLVQPRADTSPPLCLACEPGLSCLRVGDSPEKRCTRACATNADCVTPGRVCLATSEGSFCGPCTRAGETPGAEGMCCPGLEMRGGQCAVPCRTQVCFPARGASPGVCPAVTTDQCDVLGRPICPSSPPMPPSTTDVDCDGRDNDCDGRIDEDYRETSCMEQPTEVWARGPGCGRPLPGRTRCERGAVRCEHVRSRDFCTNCGEIINGVACGVCIPTPNACIRHDQCQPSHACFHDSGPSGDGYGLQCRLNPGCEAPGCWLPSERGALGVCFNP